MSEDIGLVGTRGEVLKYGRALEAARLSVVGICAFSDCDGEIEEVEESDFVRFDEVSDLVEQAEVLIVVAEKVREKRWRSKLICEASANKLIIFIGDSEERLRREVEREANLQGVSVVFSSGGELMICSGRRGAFRRAEPILKVLSSKICYNGSSSRFE